MGEERLQSLELSVEYMLSDDWKKRFIAEYAQLVSRLDALESLFWDTEDDIPKNLNCPSGLLSLQMDRMIEYIQILEIRAEIYGIDLFDEIQKLKQLGDRRVDE